MKTPRAWAAGALATLLAASGACSIQSFAVRKAAGLLSAPSGGADVFSSDNDPEFVAEALPFAVKLYESLLAAVPDHDGLRLRTGSLYIMYASAFLQTPGDMLPRREREARNALRARAKNLYLRGRDIILVGLERKNPRLRALWAERRFADAAAPFTAADAPALYWAAAGWVAAFAIDPFDMAIALELPWAAALMDRVLAVDPGFSGAAVHNFYILYYGAMPDYMGGDAAKARDHFRLAEAAGGGDTSPYLSLASTISVKEQNLEEFRSLLRRVLEADPDADPARRLPEILNHRKARWLLDHEGDYFLIDEQGPAREEDP